MTESPVKETIKMKRFVVERVVEDTNHLQVPSFRPDSPIPNLIPRSGSLSLSVHFSSEEEIIPTNVCFSVSVIYFWILKSCLINQKIFTSQKPQL